jgi:hypothetical protein
VRGALASVLVVVVSLVPGCPDPPGTSGRDVGPPPPRDGSLFGVDTSADAFDWPDTGPPLPTVLPQQSWLLHGVSGVDNFDVTIVLDARAESGVVRAVGGGGGRAASTLFDVQPDGSMRARSPLPFGLPGQHLCSWDTVWIDQWGLQFEDLDHDGTHETLASAFSAGTITRSGTTIGTTVTGELSSVSSVVVDEVGPELQLVDAAPILGLEPIVLASSEPVGPVFMPALVGAHTYAFSPEIGASAPSRWTLETSDLPPGHYDLVLDAAVTDLAGNAARAMPGTTSFDVPAESLPAIDDLDPAVVAVRASRAIDVWGDAPEEMALAGATSMLISSGPIAIVLDVTAGRREIDVLMRLHGPMAADFAPVAPYVSVRDATGQIVGQATDYHYFSAPSSVPGFDLESTAHVFAIGFTARTAGRYVVRIDPGGSADPACVGMAPVAGIGTVLDQIVLR